MVVLGLALALSPQGALQGPLKVVKVVDGDTVDLEALGRVRLIGIDAPESSMNRRTSGPEEVRLGLRAKAFLARLLQGRVVWVELDVQERDRYRRVLAYLYLEDPPGGLAPPWAALQAGEPGDGEGGVGGGLHGAAQCPLRRAVPPGRPGGEGEGGGDVGRGAGLEARGQVDGAVGGESFRLDPERARS